MTTKTLVLDHVLAGVESGQEQLLQDFWPKLIRIASIYEKQYSLQTELQQEMALAIWRALKSFRGESSVTTYMYKIAHNVAVNHIKRQMRELPLESESENISTRFNVEEDVSNKQQVELLLIALRELPIIQRQLVALSLEGIKQREIAIILGISENNVAVRLNRAKKQLQAIMRSNSSAKGEYNG